MACRIGSIVAFRVGSIVAFRVHGFSAIFRPWPFNHSYRSFIHTFLHGRTTIYSLRPWPFDHLYRQSASRGSVKLLK